MQRDQKKRSTAGKSTAARARETEQKWRAENPQASTVPKPLSDLPSRQERAAKIRLVQTYGNESDKRRAEKILLEQREIAQIKERARPQRNRPHKTLPNGVFEATFVVEKDVLSKTFVEIDGELCRVLDDTDPAPVIVNGERRLIPRGELKFVRGDMIRPAEKDERGAKKTVGLRMSAYRLEDFENVTTELAEAATALRSLFDVRPYDQARFTETSELTEESQRLVAFYGDAFPKDRREYRHARPMTIPREIANAIRGAAATARSRWISILIEQLIEARLEIEKKARGAVDMIESAKPPTQPADILAKLENIMRKIGFTLPDHVDDKLVARALERIAIEGHGGGKTRRVSSQKLREILADPTKCAVFVR